MAGMSKIAERILRWMRVEEVYEGYAPQIEAYVSTLTQIVEPQPVAAAQRPAEPRTKALVGAKA